MLKTEFKYYLAHQDEFVNEYNGKYIVLKKHDVIGVYDDEVTAYKTTKKEHEPGSFLIQKVSPGKEAYTQSFHSRVQF